MTGTKTAQIATGLDAWNRVVSLTSLGETVHCAYAPDGRFAAGSNGAFAVEYLYANIYDALERRVRKVAPAETRTFFYGGWNVLNEDIAYTNGTTATIRYVWGKDLSGSLQGAGGVGGLLATQVGGAWYFPAYDANGNITQYVDEDGHVVASYAYDAFGNTVAQSGAMASAFPFRFSTKYYDAESGLYYYGYRFYSPKLGRWLTRDPIEEAGGVNVYGFCGNAPTLFYDSFGDSPSKGTAALLKNRKNACYILTIKVDTVGFNFRDATSFVKSMAKNTRKGQHTVGHTWVALENTISGDFIEGGHSGETGKAELNPEIPSVLNSFLTYSGGVIALSQLAQEGKSPIPAIPEADPANPVRWLSYNYKDGYWASGSGGHSEVDAELSISLSKDEYNMAKSKIDNLIAGDYLKEYGLTGKQCTSTAVDIAKASGIILNPFVTLAIPSTMNISGYNIRMWSSSKYSSITFAIPDKMKDEIASWHGEGRIYAAR